jgi:predicted metal-dependent hydrolase
MKYRDPQLLLRLEAETPSAGERWRDGAPLAYLGGALTLRLDTKVKEAALAGDELHLPLPPEATPRQVQDAAEAWLRNRAVKIIGAHVVMAARRLGRPAPPLSFSFAASAGWAQPNRGEGLRCHWRLIEQSDETIAQVVARAVSALPAPAAIPDLFALA